MQGKGCAAGLPVDDLSFRLPRVEQSGEDLEAEESFSTRTCCEDEYEEHMGHNEPSVDLNQTMMLDVQLEYNSH